jgi:hypothetical protein
MKRGTMLHANSPFTFVNAERVQHLLASCPLESREQVETQLITFVREPISQGADHAEIQVRTTKHSSRLVDDATVAVQRRDWGVTTQESWGRRRRRRPRSKSFQYETRGETSFVDLSPIGGSTLLLDKRFVQTFLQIAPLLKIRTVKGKRRLFVTWPRSEEQPLERILMAKTTDYSSVRLKSDLRGFLDYRLANLEVNTKEHKA